MTREELLIQLNELAATNTFEEKDKELIERCRNDLLDDSVPTELLTIVVMAFGMVALGTQEK